MASSRPLGLTAIALVVFFLVNTDTTFVTCQESTLQEQSQDGASNNERYVSASRGSSDVEGCGSWSDPCGTLAAAAAAASSSRSSLSIILLPGAHDLTTAVEFVNATVSISGPGGWPSTQLVCTQGSYRGLAFLAGSFDRRTLITEPMMMPYAPLFELDVLSDEGALAFSDTPRQLLPPLRSCLCRR